MDRTLIGGFGILGELELLFRPEAPGGPVGALSLNGVYHFGSGTFRPFVTGGWTELLNFNVGGGVNYWIKDRITVRMELRDHLLRFGPTHHSYGLRLGLGIGF